MRLISLFISLALAGATLASNHAESGACHAAPPAEPVAGTFPDQALSPAESLHTFDTVFLGEVVVPTRKCSLGYCAGVKVIQAVKGNPDRTTLVQVATPEDAPCGPTTFLEKGRRWVVFGYSGTSHSGLKYLRLHEDGPSFASEGLPDFQKLESQYRTVRAQLDQAITDRLR